MSESCNHLVASAIADCSCIRSDTYELIDMDTRYGVKSQDVVAELFRFCPRCGVDLYKLFRDNPELGRKRA